MSTDQSIPFRQDLKVISLVGLAHGVSHFFQLLIPSIFPWLIPAFDLSFTQAGLLTTVSFAVSGLGQAPGGFIVDRFGPLRVLIFAIFLFMLSGLILSSATGYLSLLLAATFIGAGNSVFHPADFSLLNHKVSPNRLGHAFSMHGLSGNIGWAVAPIFLVAISLEFNWRQAALGASLLAALPIITFLVYRAQLASPDAPPEATENYPSPPALRLYDFVQAPVIWKSFSFFFVIALAFGGIQNFLPSIFISDYAATVTFAGSCLSTYLFGGGAGMIVGGFLVNQSEAHEHRIALVLSIAAVCLLAIAVKIVPIWLILPIIFGAGFAAGIAGPSRDMLVRRSVIASFGKAAMGRVYGLVYSGLDAGLAFSPALFGLMLDAGLSQWVLAGISSFYLTGAAVAICIAPPKT